MTEPMRQDLDRLYGMITVARLDYGILHVYTNPEDNRRYADVTDKYYWFFKASFDAHFVSMVMSLATLHDPTSGVVSIGAVLTQAGRIGAIEQDKIRELRRQRRCVRSIVEKVITLRNNAFAHSSAELNPHDVFKKAGISMSDFRQLINTTAQILQSIGPAIGIVRENLPESSGLDLLEVLSVLKGHRK